MYDPRINIPTAICLTSVNCCYLVWYQKSLQKQLGGPLGIEIYDKNVFPQVNLEIKIFASLDFRSRSGIAAITKISIGNIPFQICSWINYACLGGPSERSSWFVESTARIPPSHLMFLQYSCPVFTCIILFTAGGISIGVRSLFNIITLKRWTATHLCPSTFWICLCKSP